GESFATLEVQVSIVRSLGQAPATIVDTDKILVGFFCSPAGTDGELRIELPFDLTDIEGHAECRCGKGRGEADGQRQFCQAPVGCCFCHRRYSMCFLLWMLGL